MTEQELLQPLPANRAKHLKEAVLTFNRSLGDEARSYLEGRGIAGAVAAHGLGQVPPDSDLEWAPYRGMLTLPFFAAGGDVVNIRFRRIGPGEPKYLQLAGVTPGPYNLKVLAEDHRTVVVAEGEIEVLTLAELGIPAVGMPGVHTWKSFYRHLFDGIDNVIIWGDPDEAGRKFNAELQKSLPAAGVAYMEKDINDTYTQDGIGPILAAFEKAGGSL